MATITRRSRRALSTVAVATIILCVWWFFAIGSHVNTRSAKLSDKQPARRMAFFAFLFQTTSYSLLRSLLQALQADTRSDGTERSAYLFYADGLDETAVSRAKDLNFAKVIPLQNFTGAVASSQAWWNVSTLAFQVPMILEYLLFEYPAAAFVDLGYPFEEGNSVHQVLQTLNFTQNHTGMEGDLGVSLARLGVEVQERKGPPISVVAYTKQEFTERMRPVLNCERGAGCDPLTNLMASAFRKIAPHASCPTVGVRGGGGFSGLRRAEEELLERSNKRKVCFCVNVGLETSSFGEFLEFQLVPFLNYIRGENYGDQNSVLYIMNGETSISNGVLLRELLTVPVKDGVFFKTHTGRVVSREGNIDKRVLISALEEGCESLRHFDRDGLSLNMLPDRKDGALQIPRQTSLNPFSFPRMALMALVRGDEEVWMLRELVGSIHDALYMNPHIAPPSICIFATNLSRTSMETIKLWRFVHLYDVQSVLFGTGSAFNMSSVAGVSTNSTAPVPSHRMALMDIMMGDYGNAVWIDHRAAFGDYKGLLKMAELLRGGHPFAGQMVIGEGEAVIVVEGYESNAFARTHGGQMDCWKTGKSGCVAEEEKGDPVQVLDAASVFFMKSLLPRPSDISMRSQNYCHLMIRPEVMYNPSMLGDPSMTRWSGNGTDWSVVHNSEKTKIAFLIPSKSASGTDAHTVHLVTTFLRHFLSSVTEEEWEKFIYTLYIGYDEGDAVLDTHRDELQDVMDAAVGAHRSSVLFKYQALPPAKALTVLWNVLFVSAFHDGQDYFYQVNDDLVLETIGWSTAFVTRLRGNGGFGVTGPNDMLWKCSLLTQSFVSRTHYEIFQWYFPTEIKDWFSDNWISSVYDFKSTFCESQYTVRNGAAGTRYDVCDQPRWREAVSAGRQKIAAWKRDRAR